MFSLPVLAGFFLALASAVTIAAGSGADDSTWQPFVMQTPIPPKTVLAVGVALDQEGRLWLVKVVNQRLLVSRSEDDGRHFSEPMIVTPVPENISNDGENRPKIQVAHDGTVLITWTELLAEKYAGNIKFSRSTDRKRAQEDSLMINGRSMPVRTMAAVLRRMARIGCI